MSVSNRQKLRRARAGWCGDLKFHQIQHQYQQPTAPRDILKKRASVEYYYIPFMCIVRLLTLNIDHYMSQSENRVEKHERESGSTPTPTT